MYENFFAQRLAQLRIEKKVSARDMSLNLGYSESYINKIENNKAFPSMQVFFYICEYLQISPKDFFNDESQSPLKIQELEMNLNKLTPEELHCIFTIVRSLSQGKGGCITK